MIEVRDQSSNAEDKYKSGKPIRVKTSMLRSDLSDYSDAYIVVKGAIFIEGRNNKDIRNRFLAFKNNAPFINCISKTNNILLDNADLNVNVNKNYRKTTGSLWNYYRDEPNNPPLNDDPPTINYNVDPITDSASFKYKSSIQGKHYIIIMKMLKILIEQKKKEVEIVVPLKHLSNFSRTLDITWIKCVISLIWAWSENCVLADIITHAAIAAQRDDLARPVVR